MFFEEAKKLFAHSCCLPTCYVNYQILFFKIYWIIKFSQIYFNIYLIGNYEVEKLHLKHSVNAQIKTGMWYMGGLEWYGASCGQS